jgi:hypothetical protein
MRLLKILLLFLVCSCSRNTAVVSKLSQIPQEDRTRIEKLFSFLVWDEAFAYVLFGSKPMSVCTQEKKLPSHYLELYQSPVYELESLWKTWEKYAYLFPMSEFIFLTESNEKLFDIYLLNKSNCLKVIENNLAIFQEKTGCDLNAYEMFDYIVTNSSNNVFKKSLNKSQALYGILLGYGTENSVGFENYYVKKNHLPTESGQHLDIEDSSLPIIPCFASFSAEETQNLTADYQQQRQEILRIYSDKDFLETTINRLITQK